MAKMYTCPAKFFLRVYKTRDCLSKKIWCQVVANTVNLLLSDQLRDHQKAVTEEKGSPNATK